MLKQLSRIALALIALCAGLSAQSDNAAISGIVKDPSGAAVAGAKVLVRNEGTSFERQTTTNESGFYTVTNVPPGFYAVTIEAPGFKQF